MPKQITVKQGDTLNSISQAQGFKNYRDAGITSVPSGNFDLIRPGDVITFGDTKQAPGMLQTTTAPRIQGKRDGTALTDRTTSIQTNKDNQNAAKLAQDTIDAQKKDTTPVVDTTTTAPAVDPQITAANAKHEADITAANDQLESAKALLNTSTQALIDNIKTIYNNRLAQMKASNEALLGTVTQSGLRSGRARYLPTTQAKILSDEESKANLRMGQLEGEMLSLISKAENARSKGDLKLLNDNMNALDKIDTQLQDTVQGIQRLAVQKQAEQRLRDKLEFDQQQTDIQTGIDKSKSYAKVMIGTLDTLKTPEEKTAYIQQVADKIDVDPNILLADIKDASVKDKKASADISNIESLMSNRKRQTEISAYKAETARQKQDKPKTKSGYSLETENILRNVSTLSDVPDANKEQVKSELQKLGFYEDIPPKWFVDFKNSEVKQPLPPKKIKTDWKDYTGKVLSDNNSI